MSLVPGALPALLLLVLAIPTTAPTTARAQSRERAAAGRSEQAAAVMSHLRSLLPADAAPRLGWTEDGVLHYLGAPTGVALLPSRRESGRPEVAALAFLADNALLFGTAEAAYGFQPARTRESDGRRFVRMQQTVHGIPVFGGEMVVQLDPSDDVQAVIGNVAHGSWPVPAAQARPGIDAPAAVTAARARATSLGASAGLVVVDPSLAWFVPQVIHEQGPTTLVWSVEVREPSEPTFHYRWLLDAHDGSLVREIPLVCTISRRIYDMASDTLHIPTTLVRSEGQPACGIADADDAYDLVGDTYNFYWTRNGRDGVNGAGFTDTVTVRVCTGGLKRQCPWLNAAAGSTWMAFGLGTVKDDVVAHEWTHSVTNWESNLIYANESGSINESLSDIWGEFVDLTNGRGNDVDSVRWRMGEDMLGMGGTLQGPLRDMKDPTRYYNPDRRNSQYYYTGTDQSALVHTNSGVNNKLCYLLTDGATFNGRTVYGMGIDAVVDLYYECQTHLLVSSSGWASLSLAMQQAAVNLGWSDADQLNLYRGLLAVEIAAGQDLWVDAASSCFFPVGWPTCDLFAAPFPTVLAGQTGARPGDVLHVRTGTYFGGHLLTKPLTLRAEGGVVTIGP